MKAQRIRKTLWLVSLALGAGVVGLAALWFLEKPAEAQGLSLKAKEAMEGYRGRTPTPVLVPPVKQEDLDAYIRKPEWKSKQGGATRYYPYAGPRVPPEESAAPPPAEKVEGPKDLEATGHVVNLIYVPPPKGVKASRDSVVYWEFNGDKKTRLAFVPGEPVRADDKQPKRFVLVDVIPEQAGTARYRVLYDVFESPDDPPEKARRAELRWDGEPALDPKIGGLVIPGGPKKPPPSAKGGPGPERTEATRATSGGASVAPDAGPEAAPASVDWAPTRTEKSANERLIEFTDATADRFRGKKPEDVFNDVLKNVRTESYDKGGVTGIQVFPAENDEMAQKFDVKRGDVLISINGSPVKSKDDAIRIARGLPPDTSRVTAVIDRNGRQITYVVDPRDPKTRRAAATLGTR